MHVRIRPVVAAALVLLLSHAATDHSAATVVQDGKTGPSNPAVEIGGQPLKAGDKALSPAIPYSLIGALRSACFDWPWGMFSRSYWHHANAGPIIRPGRPGR
jgi:hypothetical protein